MSSHPAPPSPPPRKVAPAGSQPHGQAEQFTRATLQRADLDPTSPIRQFHAWFLAAQTAPGFPVAHPETCTLATASLPSGRVSARTVYLKELDSGGSFVVYTNLGTSRKAADVFGGGGSGGDGDGNPHVALVFWWEALQRQVRVEGVASRTSTEESQTYFDTRVRGSRIGAWASRQSEVLEPLGDGESGGGDGDDGRARLEARAAEAEARFDGVERIPVPGHWGGLRIVPDRIEFWQGRDNRLHDRFAYQWVAAGDDQKEGGGEGWKLMRLSP